jgi:NADH-quinone oxidoreductase subunit J
LTVNQILFGVISTLGVLAALGTVLARNLVHAALYLVAFFFLIACQFVMLEAEFLAAVQVLVYIGAVAILMMFGIMLTRNISGDDHTGVAGDKPVRVSGAGMVAAGLASLGLLAVLVTGIINEEGPSGQKAWRAVTTRPAVAFTAEAKATPKAKAVNNMGEVVGVELLTRYLIPFEVAGILLTAALVGAIALAVQEGKLDDDPSARVKTKQRDELEAEATRPESTLTSAGV